MDKLRIRQAIVVEGKYDLNALRQLVDTPIFTTNGFTTYPVTILLREFGDLNPGMNVSADIVVERTTGVLCVPVSAVNSDGTVLVAGPGTLSEDGLTIADLSKAERRPVELGRSNEEYIEITSGLSQDEVVLVPDQATGSMGAVAMGG